MLSQWHHQENKETNKNTITNKTANHTEYAFVMNL